jgi:hypothetical protein
MSSESGLDPGRNRQHVLDSGFDAFLAKPMTFEDVTRALE